MRIVKIIVLILFINSLVLPKEFDIDKSKKNLVEFISNATFQEFEGVTNNIDGYLFNSNNILSGSEIYFEVDLRTLDTGIGLRNRDMRENYLKTDKYPMTNYKGKIIYADKVSDAEYKVTVDGKMFIHGVTRDLKVNGNLFPVEDGYRVKAYFEILLSDYDVKIPKLMFMKISNTIKLVLDFYLKEINK